MSDASTAAIIVAIAGGAGAGAYLLTRKKVTTPTPTSNYTVTITGPASVTVNTTNTYTVTVLLNGTSVTGASVTLNGETSTTGTNGSATFQVTFPSVGTVTLTAQSEGVTATLSVTVTAAAPTCTDCSGCPSGYNCVNGQCVQLIPSSINIPATVTAPTGYIEWMYMLNLTLPLPVKTTALAILKSPTKFCSLVSLPSSPTTYTLEITVSGTVQDADGHGVNGIEVSGSITGGGGWVVHTGSGDTFQGTATPSLTGGNTTTDCSGNFSFTVSVAIEVEFSKPLLSGNENTQWYNMGLSPMTLSVSSGNLGTVNSIITLNEFISHEQCNYTGGILD